MTGEDEKEDEAAVLEALTGEEFRYVITEYLFSHLTEAIEKNKKSFVAFRLTSAGRGLCFRKKTV